MKRSLVFVLVAAFSLVLSAAVFADTSSDVTSAVNAALHGEQAHRRLLLNQRDEAPSQVQSDAQALVGVPVDQLTHGMGSPKWVSVDANGGKVYTYWVGFMNAGMGSPLAAYEYFNVGADGTVASADVNVD